MDVLRKQTANKKREGKYRKMAINQIAQRKKHNEYQASFNQDMQQIDETIMKMQQVEVETIRDGGGTMRLDPLQEQYMGLASSIIALCQEENIADIVLDYLKGQNELAEMRDRGETAKAKSKLEEATYSAALEVILHATRHILDADNVDINEQDRVFLISRIMQVKCMFEEELKYPELIAKKKIDPKNEAKFPTFDLGINN